MPKEEINDLARRASDELSKYTHLLLAFSASAIAYALNQAQGRSITWESVPLLLALVAWCASMYFGVKHLQLHRAHMIENAQSLIYDESREQMLKRLLPLDIKAEKSSSKQYWLIFFGIASYVAWYIACAVNA
jgi:hypothetical protein